MKMLIGGVIGGLIGAAIWAGVVYATQYEIGWIAIGVGFLVGLGVQLGASEQSDGLIPGLLAVGLSVGAIVLAKFLTVHFMFGIPMDGGAFVLTDDNMIAQYAEVIAEKHEESGVEVKWPEVGDDENAPIVSLYPKEIWEEAKIKWNEHSAAEKETKKKQTEEKNRKAIEKFTVMLRNSAFKESFGGIDILFFLIAAYTAFNVGSGGSDD